MLLRCGTKDAEAEYASAVQWSSSRGVFLGSFVDILSFFFFPFSLGYVWDGELFYFYVLVPFFFFFFFGKNYYIYLESD